MDALRLSICHGVHGEALYAIICLMIRLHEFSSRDGKDKLEFIKNADLAARGFNIVSVFKGVKTVEQMQNKITELNELVKNDLSERKFYWIFKDDTLIGVATLRPVLNDFSLNNTGHIGIAIDKAYRNQGYGTEALKKLCENASLEYKIKDFLLMALTDNITSRSMIENAGGKYYDTVTAVDGEKLARYWLKR